MNFFSRTFHWVAFENAKKITRSRKFLEEMNEIILWDKFLKRINKHYYNSEIRTWRKKFDSKLMLKIYFLQQWYNLSDPWVEDAIYDRLSFQQFLWIDIGKKWSVPDETTILHFRHFLEKHNLQERFFDIVKKMMEQEWFIMYEWTSVDATLIKAPTSTKNKDKKRDPEMSSTVKNGSFHFWMKVHIGADHESGLVHSVSCTGANVHDSKEFFNCISWNEQALFWDKAYGNKILKQLCRETGIFYGILDKNTRNRRLSNTQKIKNKQKTDVRKKVEFNFGIIKHLWWHIKVRYRGLEKNTKHFFWLFALSNLYKYNQIQKRKALTS